jgi:hypothetical protein
LLLADPSQDRAISIGAEARSFMTSRWVRLSRRMIARHVGQHGYVCPGVMVPSIRRIRHAT